MSLEMWFAFVLTSALLLVMPGPAVLTVISYSLSHGRSARLPLLAAVALGDSTALAVSILGLGALLAASSFWFTTVKTLAGIYLLYLGLRLLRTGVSPTDAAAPTVPGSRRRIFANTYLVTALNPKGIVFYVAFLPQFVNPAADPGRQLWLLAVTFVSLAMVNVTCYSVFAVSARRLLSTPRSQRYFNCAGGSLLSAAGVWALLAKRA